ncbi:MAG: cadmium-translocating P-type ATPase [Desulfosarcina sp.]|nr:cadmium-translocating P-type ATPase [Desulfobacterales bacterium]
MKPTAEKFSVKNLDCAACAAKIENGLKALDGVDEAVLDFATLTLHVTAVNTGRILEAVRRIQPDIELVPKSQGTGIDAKGEEQGGIAARKELMVLAVASSLFFLLLFSENWLPGVFPGKLKLVIVLAAYFIAGWNVLTGAFKTIKNGLFFDENVLMVIATLGAIAIHAYAEAVGVMIFYKIGELLQGLAVSRSRRSIKSLLAIRPDTAVVKTADGYRETAPESVNVGDVILIKPGEKVPLDGNIISGRSQLDSAVLTGESLPVSARTGDPVMAGQINKTGALTVRVSRLFNESSISRVMELVENATARKARTEKFITTFARYYTPAVVVIAAAIAFIPPLLIADATFQTWIYRALVLLVISCPCALVVSIPLGYFGGIGRASHKGILVKGSNYIDALSAVDTVVFDKTGTLTRGVFEVKEIVGLNGFSGTQLLELAAAAGYHSVHPLAASILKAFSETGRELDPAQISDHGNIAGKGVKVRYGQRRIMVGNDNLLHSLDISHPRCDFDATVAHIVVDGAYTGYITMGDVIHPDAEKTIGLLRDQGVSHIAMLTGDNACTAQAVSQRLGLDSFHADLLPEDKVRILEQRLERKTDGKKGKIAFVGDGINDAPVIARADVGVAMGALGSDAAIETADVVLMQDSPLKMAEAIAIAKRTRQIVWQNIGLAFVIKGVFIVFGAFGLATMWEAVFADMGTALLAVANSTRIIGK